MPAAPSCSIAQHASGALLQRCIPPARPEHVDVDVDVDDRSGLPVLLDCQCAPSQWHLGSAEQQTNRPLQLRLQLPSLSNGSDIAQQAHSTPQTRHLSYSW